MIKKEQMKIVSHIQIAEDIFELTLAGELVLAMNDPGQFVHVKVSDGMDPLLRRPISIANINQEKQECTLIYRREGLGTRVLSEKTSNN